MPVTTPPLRSVAERNALAEQWHALPRRVLQDILRGDPSLARRLTAIGLEDLGQVGQLALLHAAALWDEGQGFQYSTLAYRCVRNAILNEARRRTHRHLQCSALSEFFDPPASPNDPEAAATPPDIDALRAALLQLPPLERDLINAYFGIAGPRRSYRELGLAYGRSGERVRQVIRRTLAWLALRLRGGPCPPPAWTPDPPVARSPSGSVLWTVKQAAEALGLPAATVRSMRRQGQLPPDAVVRLGAHTVRFNPEVLTAWVSAGCPPVGRPAKQARKRLCFPAR